MTKSMNIIWKIFFGTWAAFLLFILAINLGVFGKLPSLVELAAAADSWDALLTACRERGDEITFTATLAARKHTQQSR